MTISNQNDYFQDKIQDVRPRKWCYLHIYNSPACIGTPPAPPNDPLKPTFFHSFFVFFQMKHVAIARN